MVDSKINGDKHAEAGAELLVHPVYMWVPRKVKRLNRKAKQGKRR